MPPKTDKKRIPNLTIENARIVFRNFSGLEGRYNLAGNRNFCVLIDPDEAEILKEDGWNIKWLKPRDEDDAHQAYLKVKVSYKKIPPKIVLVNDNRKTELDEETLQILDWADIDYVDLIINPSRWEMSDGKNGISAYVKTMYITLTINEIERKYRDIPDSASSILQEDDQP